MTDRKRPPIVVFVCVQNAGRSQIAEALFNRAADGRALGRSAGSRPAEAVHPIVVEAMAEVGIDLSAAKPKPLGPDVLDGADWEVADPANASLNGVRGIRKDINRLVDLLLADVVG